MSKKSKKNDSAIRFLKAFLTTLIVSVVIMFICMNVCDFGNLSRNITDDKIRTFSRKQTVDEPDKNADPHKVVATANISGIGDLLIHAPVFNSVQNSDGSYDFTSIFTLVKPYIEKFDYSIINLEVSLGGTENGRKYSGYPLFNCPDSIVDAAKYMGNDMLLLANNHTYDCGLSGLYRKIDVIREKGMELTGLRRDTSEKPYVIKDINGIKIGIINYTYETTCTGEGNKAINGIVMDHEANDLVNSFNYEKLDEFYNDLQNKMEMMKSDGAEVIVVFPHWGTEYNLTGDDYQAEMSQKMCNLGVDLIIGGHPHVVEPVKVFKSETSGKTTACLYSMGNFISNQRRNYMNLSTGNTEDGLIFTAEFTKYADGTVKVSKIGAIPTWVNLENGKYTVIPLDKDVPDWKSAFNLSDNALTRSKESYERTMKLIGEGIEEYNNLTKQN